MKKTNGRKAVIFANGDMGDPEKARGLLQDADLIIAADGGTRHCDRLGIVPDLVVGDFDSTDPALLEAAAASGADVVRHPVRKDRIDLELALEEATARGADTAAVLGGLGGRWDMSLASILSLAGPLAQRLRLRLVEGETEISLMRGGERRCIQGRAGDTLSLLPLGDDAEGVTLTGLEYPLTGATIAAGTALGVSNALTGETAEVRLARGTLLCVHIRCGG